MFKRDNRALSTPGRSEELVSFRLQHYDFISAHQSYFRVRFACGVTLMMEPSRMADGYSPSCTNCKARIEVPGALLCSPCVESGVPIPLWHRHRTLLTPEVLEATLEPHYDVLTAVLRASELWTDLLSIIEAMECAAKSMELPANPLARDKSNLRYQKRVSELYLANTNLLDFSHVD